MMDVELVPIGTLDRHNLAERRLDDFLSRVESGRLIDFPAEEQMYVLLHFFLAVVRRRAGLHRRYHYRDALVLELATLSWIAKGNALDPIYEKIDEALKALDEDPEHTKHILGTMIEEREKHFSEIQSARRKGLLSESALDSEVRKILKRNPEQTWREVLDKLERRIDLGVIIEVTGTHIRYLVSKDTDQAASLAKSSLPNKVSAIRKSITNGTPF